MQTSHTSTSPKNDSDVIRVLIVDDHIPSVDVLVRALRPYAPRVEVCGTATDLSQARRMIAELSPDLVFLDIEFPDEDESGLDLLEAPDLLGADIDVVFYTSYRKYLIQALRMAAFDFLLKPFDAEELGIIMQRYLMGRDRTLRRRETLPLRINSEATRRDSRALSITTVTNDRVIVSPDQIIFFKYDSERKLWEVVLSTLQRLILKRHTTAETILNYGEDFIRTHKAYIVNIAYLGMITATGCTLLPPYDEITEIKISKSYRRQLLDRFYDL